MGRHTRYNATSKIWEESIDGAAFGNQTVWFGTEVRILGAGLSVGYNGAPGSGQIVIDNANFAIYKSSSYIVYLYDSGDYFAYERTSNLNQWYMSSSLRMQLEPTGMLTLTEHGGTDSAYHGLLVTTRSASNTGQHINIIRAGNIAWSIGIAYNTNTFAIGTGQGTDSNFSEANSWLSMRYDYQMVGIGGVYPVRSLHVKISSASSGTVRLETYTGGNCQIEFYEVSTCRGLIGGNSGAPVYFLSAAGATMAYFNTNGDFYPGADNAQYFGTGALRWKDLIAVSKTSVLDVPWGSGKTYISVLEGPEYKVYDSGNVTLDATGDATVAFDPKFKQISNLDLPYQITTSGANVVAKNANGFILKGVANRNVDWFVIAIRAGFENIRWRDPLDSEPRGLEDPEFAIRDKHIANNTNNESERRRLYKKALNNIFDQEESQMRALYEYPETKEERRYLDLNTVFGEGL